jgi:hypothetical protein
MEIIPSSGKAIAYCYWKGSAGSKGKSAGPNLADGKWHTLSCEKHATSVAIVVDGVRYTSTRRSAASTTRLSSRSVRRRESGGDWYKGRMDEVSVTIG